MPVVWRVAARERARAKPRSAPRRRPVEQRHQAEAAWRSGRVERRHQAEAAWHPWRYVPLRDRRTYIRRQTTARQATTASQTTATQTTTKVGTASARRTVTRQGTAIARNPRPPRSSASISATPDTTRADHATGALNAWRCARSLGVHIQYTVRQYAIRRAAGYSPGPTVVHVRLWRRRVAGR